MKQATSLMHFGGLKAKPRKAHAVQAMLQELSDDFRKAAVLRGNLHDICSAGQGNRNVILALHCLVCNRHTIQVVDRYTL